MEEAEDALVRLRADYVRRYGAVIFDVAVTKLPGTLHLSGRVLLPAQSVAAEGAVRAATDLAVENDIIVLTEGAEVDAWLRPARPIVDVYSCPEGDLSTQVIAGDPPLRRLTECGDWWVVELADGTVGWVVPAAVAPITDPVPEGTAAWRADWCGRPRPAGEAEWRAALTSWWGAPYRWGGCTRSGVDCSGLTQRLYKEVVGIGLPKHSAAQLRVGRRIALAALATGDLVGLRHRQRPVGHVAVVLGGEPVRLAHASLNRGVCEEPLEAVLERYRLRGARRFAP